MKFRCHLPKAVHQSVRAVVAEALRQAKCHSQGMLVEIHRGSRGYDHVSGHAGTNTIGVYKMRSRKTKRGRRYRTSRTECDGRITMTASWPPRDPLSWAQKLHKLALHEAAHFNLSVRYAYYDTTLPWADRPQEEHCEQVAYEGSRAMPMRRQNLLIDLAIAVEQYLQSKGDAT